MKQLQRLVRERDITTMAGTQQQTKVEQWGIFELVLQGSAEGNPFLEGELTAQFAYRHRAIEVDGFYDGDGIYRIRFMLDTQVPGITTHGATRPRWMAPRGRFCACHKLRTIMDQ
jgi:hypothetical protein